MSGPVTSVAREEDVQIFLKDPVYIYIDYILCKSTVIYSVTMYINRSHAVFKGVLPYVESRIA